MRPAPIAWLVAAAMTLAVAGCDPNDDGGVADGGSGDTGDDGGDGIGEGDDGTGAAADGCEAEDRADEFVAGMEKDGEAGLVTVALLESQPAPPIRDDNRFTVLVTDADGVPVTGAELEVEPRMPDHGHGTPVVAEVEPGEASGEYVLDPVNLFMQGYWEVHIDVVLPSGDEDGVMFGFCVD